MRVIGGDDIVTALDAHLREHLPDVVRALGLTELGDVATWMIVPDIDAITAAKLPAVAVVVGGMTQTPERTAQQYRGVWSASIGIFDRGSSHADTQKRIAAWAKAIRTTFIAHPLTGTGMSVRWQGEEYDLIPSRNAARTLAGAEVMLDVTVDIAVDLTDLPPGSGPLVRSVHNRTTIQE